jgi:hypothetical protein
MFGSGGPRDGNRTLSQGRDNGIAGTPKIAEGELESRLWRVYLAVVGECMDARTARPDKLGTKPRAT